jgi:cyclic beta-1,2-glucan synthetase
VAESALASEITPPPVHDETEHSADDLGLLSPSAGALEAPIRSILFGVARFEQHGRSLAQTHAVRPGRRGGQFFPRLAENVAVLQRSRRLLENRAARGRHLGPAAHWLLDNAALIDEQTLAIRQGLPRSFFRILPLLRDEPLAGLPRIYSVAWAWVAHTDSGFDPALLEAYLRAYQEEQSLTLAELWALHTTLRVVLVENLRRLAERTATQQAARDAAHRWLDHADNDPELLALGELTEQVASRGVAEPFLLTLVQRQEELASEPAHPLDAWLHVQLPEVATALSRQQNEAAEDQQSIRNAITTLRELERVDWRALVSRCSTVMALMDRSPVHAAETEATQDATLHEIERLARSGDASETQVAQTLLELTTQAADPQDPRAAPAYWWRGEGENELHRRLGLPPRRWPRRGLPAFRRAATPLYLLVVTALTVGAVAWLLHRHADLSETPWLMALTALLLLGPVSEAVVAVVNRMISESVRPTVLPRLAFDAGVPAEHRPLVVIPALLGSANAAAELAEQLEQHYLANSEPRAQFALLTDFVDAATPATDADGQILGAARRAVQSLNERHPRSDGAPRFLLLHRERQWSESEQCWMGWERKRGKLEQLIRALCEPGHQPFIALGALSQPAPDIAYVLTLDADTGLPPGRLAALVGMAAHPLNRPQIDVARRRVVAGYGILQPRVVTPLPQPEQITWYHALFSGQCGTDAYSTASSEVYQDVFGEGSFTGKGLLNVRALHATLVGRLPQEQVLSHDLLEGSLARCATVSDITLEEEAPMHADVAASRLHRWTRGDWQLLPFLLRPGRTPMGWIHRWKMIDNLRRSLVAPTACALVLLAAATGALPLGWALLVVAAAFSAGPLLGSFAALAPSRDDVALRPFFRQGLADVARALMASVWHGAQLLQLGLLYLDALTRANWRQAVSRRHLLQWTTAAAAQAQASTVLPVLLKRHLRTPLAALVVAAALAGLAFAGHTVRWPLVLPLLGLWSATGLWTWLASRPRPRPRRAQLDTDDTAYLHGLARDTWRYYERHIGPADHHLPPDNVQFSPHMMVAHRTSPTNIGLYLLATACAREMGFIGAAEMAERLAATLDTLDRLPRHRGHFYNWYDTQSLEILAPAYVSTVDSGNCSAHLLVVAEACEALAQEAPGPQAASQALANILRRLQGLPPAPVMDLVPGLAALVDDIRQQPWPLTTARAAALQAPVQAAFHQLDTLCLGQDRGDDARLWMLHDLMSTFRSLLRDRTEDLDGVRRHLHALGARARAMGLEAEYAPLYNRQQRLLHIGLRVDTQQLDGSHYDLLASESRLTSLLAIAKGDVPVEHWSALGRPFFAEGTRTGLRSWSGSMFEYLMPTLVLDEPLGSVLQQAGRSAVALQQAEAQGRDTPWGISESAIASQDHTLAYQYGPQGAPRLALRRTPLHERVIAPYATALALLVDPQAAVLNLRALQKLGARRSLGFMEAIDYTPQRQAAGSSPTLVHTYMTHHQAMSLVALCCVLNNDAPRRWAGRDAHLRAVRTLLHERAPREVPALRNPPVTVVVRRPRGAHLALDSQPLQEALPSTQWLSNGRYAVMLRGHGSGWSQWHGQGLNRWRDDLLRDAHGHFFYLQREGEPARHSLTAHPAPDARARYRCRMQPDRVIFDARWPDLEANCTVWVSPEDDCELRQVVLTNTGTAPLTLTLSSAAEPTLTPPRADEAHPAFSNLFIQARWDAAERALYLRRKQRLPDERGLYAAHCLAVADEALLGTTPCADRLRWWGRYGSAAQPMGQGHAALIAQADDPAQVDPATLLPGVPLDTGLDPMAVISARVRLAPGASTTLTFMTAAAETPDQLEALVDKYRQPSHVERASNMSHTMASILLRELQFDADTWTAMLLLNTLLSSLVTRERPADALTRPGADTCNRRSLWRYGIGGDRPILCVTIRSEDGLGLVHTLTRALPVWTSAGVGVDLVVINGEAASYLTPVHHQLLHLAERQRNLHDDRTPAANRAALRILNEVDLGAQERATLQALARVRLQADGRSLSEHVTRLVDEHRRDQDDRKRMTRHPVPPMLGTPQHGIVEPARGAFDAQDGSFGFDVRAASHPARPWVNVLANPSFGCQVSEMAGGYTWAHNSRMHQITRWSNDPIADPASEWLLLQDRDSGRVWSLGRGLDGNTPRQVTHGIGFTRMTQQLDGIDVTLTWCVDTQDTLKQVQVQLRSTGTAPRSLRLVAVAEWLLGSGADDRLTVATACARLKVSPEGAGLPAPRTVPALMGTQLEHGTGFGLATAILALRHVDAKQMPQDVLKAGDDWTCDRRELVDALGRAVLPTRLGQRSGTGLDACAALGCSLTLAPQAATEVTVLLGHAMNPADAQARMTQAWLVDPAQRLRHQTTQWDTLVGSVRVESPDPLFNALVNHWLPYQTVVCRLWARAGFYQAGGAFGFRDQLQDAMALVTRAPHLLAAQIRTNAARQFKEGDVQHWWHEPGGAGVRTHFSDDRLWLPSALALYVGRTGDTALLDEVLPFLESAPIPAGAEDLYETPALSGEQGSLYEHAARAIDVSLGTGVHGLPLIGTGDWNDGMNRVGHEGRGESVWLGWFLCQVVDQFLPLAERRGDDARVHAWRAARQGWVAALDDAGWDGEWYRRGYFDDGTPLGAAQNSECRIDLIAQAWAVLTGAGRPERAGQAFDSAQRELWDGSVRVMRLLHPPLQHASPSAGYIQGYPPGVRENGGQYNHAAVWSLMAAAKLQRPDWAWRLFTAISPAHRAAQPAAGAPYGAEPYVMAGDIYSHAPWAGRGGWSWYTGSSGWMLCAAVESLCGLVQAGRTVTVSPCLPPHWDEVTVQVRVEGVWWRFVVCATPVAVAQAQKKHAQVRVVRVGETVDLGQAKEGMVHIVHGERPSGPAAGIGPLTLAQAEASALHPVAVPVDLHDKSPVE